LYFRVGGPPRALSAITIVTQAIPQLIAAVLIRRCRPDIDRPFGMWLYPAPVLLAFAGWLFVLSGNQASVLVIAVIVVVFTLDTHFGELATSPDAARATGLIGKFDWH